MKNYRQQLKKGIMATVILKIIASKTTYGYEIIKALRQYQTLVTKEGSLYPILYRLEDEAWSPAIGCCLIIVKSPGSFIPLRPAGAPS